MIIENTEIPKYTFSGHDSFQCRQLWLKKGYDYVHEWQSFNDEDAVVKPWCWEKHGKIKYYRLQSSFNFFKS